MKLTKIDKAPEPKKYRAKNINKKPKFPGKVEEEEKEIVSIMPRSEPLHYSVLVERYLLSHKYECFNVVKPWKFKNTDHTTEHRK